jgi:hypothetical protein
MIIATALPKIKAFLRPARLGAATQALLVRLIAAFLHHPGRMSASAAAGSIRSQARHRAQLARFLARCHWSKDWAVLTAVADLLLRQEARRRGTWVFLLDQTYVGQQGQHTENPFSCGNRQRRPRKGRRYQKRKLARRSCHGFVCGLLLSPSGLRIPCCRCYYTEAYCRDRGLAYKKQPQLAAELISALAVPEGAAVVVLGDTAFEAQDIRRACAGRGFRWVVPINPERVLAGVKPRPQVRSLSAGLSAEHFEAVRLVPGQGAYAAQRRPARCRVGPKSKARTFYVHPERRAVHNVGDVLLVFSTKEQPQPGQAVLVQKVLMTDDVSLSGARVVELYDLRWQIELFFKECKGTLGLHRYRFREFAKVEGWAQACLVAFAYLEWYRAQQLGHPSLPPKQRRWWEWQRSYGLSRAVWQQAEEHDLTQLWRWSGSRAGRKRLRQALRQAQPREYRPAG